ncbi:MBL fold metallo-hydrolase [Pseudoxanthobacter sp.]|uniref:MBL fold metallo-hydrolase n=1 Tax=Pseudoxanthobacter sp. TaxID=1925742 RepID=UPI002FE41CA8
MSTESSPPQQPLKVFVVPVTPFRQNASILVCGTTNKAAIVDPGGDIDTLLTALAESGGEAEKILLTHGHLDHAGAAADLAERLGIPVEGPHRADEFLLQDLPAAGARFGLEMRPVSPDLWLEEGDTVTVGAVEFDVRHVPGHTPGHVVFLAEGLNFGIVGDTLFAGTIGRTDFPYGSQDQLVQAIREKLMVLDDAFTVLPGHGQATTIGQEREINPYVR